MRLRDKRRLLLVDPRDHFVKLIKWLSQAYPIERLGELNGKVVLRFRNKFDRDWHANLLREHALNSVQP